MLTHPCFEGVVVYADDVLLMAPTRGAMQLMLNKCENYASEHNIMFSTDQVQVIEIWLLSCIRENNENLLVVLRKDIS